LKGTYSAQDLVVAEPDDQPTEEPVELVFNPAPLSFPKLEIETEFHTAVPWFEVKGVAISV